MEPKHTILVVDDEAEVRQLLREFLERNGFDVVTAEDGEQALKLAGEHVPDLVITDLLLPKEHGIELMQAIKDTFFLPVIAVSGIYRKDEVQGRLGDVFIDGYFEKPLDLQGVLACVRSILNG
jgi:DNA-binding response OmpR family regulator